MPPVFGPVSPSPSRLWSCDVASGSTCRPSTMAMKLASSPSQELLDHDGVAGLAEAPGEHVLRRRNRRLDVVADHDALAGGETIGLDDERRALRAHPAGIERRARERRIRRRRNAVPRQEILGERLRAFETRSEPARTEAAQTRGVEGIANTEHERRFGSDDRQVDALRPRRNARDRQRHRPRRRRCAFSVLRPCPDCPGATNTADTRADWATFHASACSRPPAPMTRTRTAQCLKWRMPVKTIAMPCSSAAAMTSASRRRSAGLDHRGDALLGGRVQSVAEREERVGSHDRAGRIETFVARFHARDARRDDAAHLAGTDADRRAVAREHDRVRLDVLADAPREQQVVELLPAGHGARHDLETLASDVGDIAGLCQQSAIRSCAARGPA